MKLRLSANTWVLIVLSVIVVAVGSEAARVYLGDKTGGPSPDMAKQYDPDFKVGDPAPDFSLKDKDSVPHSLTSLVKGDTLLMFICGCENCRNMQNYMVKCFERLGDRAPAVVSVATIDPASEAAYRRDVKLKQTILYDNTPNPTKMVLTSQQKIGDIYKGHPCPRIFRLSADRKVTWIGRSPAQMPSPNAGYQMVAAQLGMRWKGDHDADPSAPEAPVPNFSPPPAIGTTIPKHTVPGH